MTKSNRPESGPLFDPFTLVGTTADGAWTFTVRLVASPSGLKMWSLIITPQGVSADDPPPPDAPGAGINTGVLKMISFPQIREVMTRQTDKYLARVLEELDTAAPEDRELLQQELGRVEREVSRSAPPRTNRPGRPAADDDQRAEWALDVLGHKDHHGYRQELRQLWNRREGSRIKERTVDTRMRRLNDSGWLDGTGKVAKAGPKLAHWLKSRSDSRQATEQE